MQIIFIILSSISLASGSEWSVDLQSTCNCNSLRLQSECALADCNWSPYNVCQDVNCTTLDQSQCYSNQKTCAYNTKKKSCTSFDYCNKLDGKSQNECISQNPSCTWISGNSCVSFSNCQKFNTTNCPNTCLNTGTLCQSFTSCVQLNQTLCNSLNYCYWQGSCQTYQCKDYLSYESCIVGEVQSSSAQPCLWKSGACVNAQNQQVFDSNTCFTHTAQTYHWAPKDDKQSISVCKPCFQLLFNIQIVLIFLIL